MKIFNQLVKLPTKVALRAERVNNRSILYECRQHVKGLIPIDLWKSFSIFSIKTVKDLKKEEEECNNP